MTLSDRDIRERIERGDIVVTPSPPDPHLQPASIDLRLDPQHVLMGPDGGRLERTGPILMRPGCFALACTLERVHLPRDVVGRVEGKSTWARRGLQVHAAGFIDPGFEGQITLELALLGPEALVLYPGVAICQIAFSELSSPALRPYGSPGLGSHYQGQRGPTRAA